MVEYKELKFTNNRIITIEANIKDSPFYTNVYLDKIQVCNMEGFDSSDPTASDFYYTYTSEGNQKSASIWLDPSYYKIKNDELVFIVTTTKGAPSSDTPCGLDNIYTVGIIVYDYDILRSIMSYVKQLGNNCVVPKGLIDIYFKYKTLKLAAKLGDYDKVIYYYNKFFKHRKTIEHKGGCGCNG